MEIKNLTTDSGNLLLAMNFNGKAAFAYVSKGMSILRATHSQEWKWANLKWGQAPTDLEVYLGGEPEWPQRLFEMVRAERFRQLNAEISARVSKTLSKEEALCAKWLATFKKGNRYGQHITTKIGTRRVTENTRADGSQWIDEANNAYDFDRSYVSYEFRAAHGVWLCGHDYASGEAFHVLIELLSPLMEYTSRKEGESKWLPNPVK